MKDQKGLLQLQEENESLRLRLSETERELAFKSKALEESAGQRYMLGTGIDITRQKRGEQALRESEERYHSLFTAMQEAFALYELIFDEAGTAVDYVCLESNPAYEQIMGLPANQYLGKSARSVLPNVDAKMIELLGKVVLTGERVRFETYSRDLKRWLAVSSYRVGAKRVVTLAFDITERKRAEEALRASEAKFRSLFENSPDAVLTAVPGGPITGANPAACAMFGMSEEELCWAGRAGIEAPEDPAPAWALEERARTGKVRYEATHVCKDGSKIPTEVASVVMDGGGGARSIVIIRNITERKRAEEELERQRKQLLAVIESLDEAVGVWNTDGSLVLINDATAKLYGFEMKEQMLKHLSDYADVQVRTMDGRELPQEEWPPSRALRGETFSNWELEQYIPSINKRFIGNNSGRPIRDANGKIILGVTSVRDITERKQAEEVLRESEEKYRRIIETANEGIILGDPDGKINFVNRKMADMLGYSVEEIIGKIGLDFMTEDQKEKVITNRAKLKHKGQVQDEFCFQRKDGSVLWTISGTAPIINDKGEHTGNIAMHTDITDHKRAEEASAFQSWLLSEVNDAVFSSDINFTINYWNKAAELMFGWTKDEAMGKISSELLKPKTDVSSLEDIRSSLRNKGYWDGEGQYMRKDGTYFFVEVHSKTLKDANGTYMGQLIVVRDITERKLAEDELRKREIDLLDATQKYRSLFNNSTVSLAYAQTLFDSNNRPVDYMFLEINNAYENSVGFKREQIVGKKITEVFPGVSQDLIDKHNQVAVTGIESHFEIGEPTIGMWFDVNVFSPKKGYFIALSYNITERKKAEIKLKERESQLIELNKTKDKFFNIVAHDMKNPFTSILGSSELLYQNINAFNQESVKNLALILNESAKSGYLLLLNLLDWSRSQTGMLKILYEKIDLNDTVDANIKYFQLTAQNKGITIISEAEDNYSIISDRNIINTILRNLLSNAIKFTYRNGKVKVRLIANHENVTIRVTDNGVGISQDKIGTIFNLENVISLPGTENEIGTGLGLKLSKELIEKLGGIISVESEYGKGTTFVCAIPKNNLRNGDVITVDN